MEPIDASKPIKSAVVDLNEGSFADQVAQGKKGALTKA